jgi:predicted RNase H-like nuclease (RuvC/YqgF family)
MSDSKWIEDLLSVADKNQINLLVLRYNSDSSETGIVIRNATELINQTDKETVTNEMLIDALNEQAQKIRELKNTNKSLIKDVTHMSNMYDQLWKKLERLIKGQNPNPTL